MTINWKSVGWLVGLLVSAALILSGAQVVAQRDRDARLVRGAPLVPLATGFAVIAPADPALGCQALPTGIRLSDRPTGKAWMDHHFQGADWVAVSDRMRPGDDVYAYSKITHPPPGLGGFSGQSGGYVVLRGWCLVGQFGTWVE